MRFRRMTQPRPGYLAHHLPSGKRFYKRFRAKRAGYDGQWLGLPRGYKRKALNGPLAFPGSWKMVATMRGGWQERNNYWIGAAGEPLAPNERSMRG